ncbi:hypothetical protein NEHOM01_2240 [Nematocida homosporus]|uniref:uncharacterized protein n=1 Tax=Nematocida homosporus TaxID=1912981 RepID=UPI00222051EF|nr:uncharacterized protein NEHOM01_2240 [Nematocida homosporus]KAI5187521.1 hypothetical protein NEHOM01_2240 [Nematocida homosporus]
MFDINEANQPRRYGLSGIALQGGDWAYLTLDWEESELMKLLDVLKKFSKFILNVESVEISYPRGPAGLLVLAQLLTLFENPELNATKEPLNITIYLRHIASCPSLESSFNNVDLQNQFRNQIEKIEESRYIIRLKDISGLTSDIQKFIWPLATHLSISYMGIVHPQMDKIDFLNDVNWIDQFILALDLDYQKDLTISLGARTAKGIGLPFCGCISIHTNIPDHGQPSSRPPKICLTGLTEYLGPNSYDKSGKLLGTLVWVSPVISTKDGHKLDHLKRVN